MRALVMLYGVISYFLFFIVFLYMIAFVGGFYAPKTLASPATMSTSSALAINIGLILLWGIQHTVMARPSFKKSISNFIPQHTERSTYVLASTVVLAIVMYFWQPIEGHLWNVENPTAQTVIWVIFAFGWALVLIATFLTDHFDLFGLRQTWLHFVKKSYTPVNFTERYLYRWIRHPMMLGLILAFWAIPTMATGHLVFAVGMTVYIFIGIHFEEKGLAKTIGIDYQDYQMRTKKIIPKVY